MRLLFAGWGQRSSATRAGRARFAHSGWQGWLVMADRGRACQIPDPVDPVDSPRGGPPRWDRCRCQGGGNDRSHPRCDRRLTSAWQSGAGTRAQHRHRACCGGRVAQARPGSSRSCTTRPRRTARRAAGPRRRAGRSRHSGCIPASELACGRAVFNRGLMRCRSAVISEPRCSGGRAASRRGRRPRTACSSPRRARGRPTAAGRRR